MKLNLFIYYKLKIYKQEIKKMIEVELDWNGNDLDIYIDSYFLGSIDKNNISEEAEKCLTERNKEEYNFPGKYF